ncbi:MAG: Maf family protein [Sporomusaceae bacterium]|nr:Maf family protein [Sporomusaceae bacterium]
MQLILASASPRRRQLLEQVGLTFSVQASLAAEELKQGLTPSEQAKALAADKAAAVAADAPGAVIIGADTIVVHRNEIFGKPANAVEAHRMLRALAGCRHQVITGVAVIAAGNCFSDFAQTEVSFRALSDAEIAAYIQTAEWADKAGAYGIQGMGALLVERIEGCYSNVVGLPLTTLARLLLKAGVRLL